MSVWSEQDPPRVEDQEPRQASGGYNFGGYIPGEEYLPAPRKRGRQIVAAAIALVTICTLVVMMAL